MPIQTLASFFHETISAQIVADSRDLTEIRLRAGKPPQLISLQGDRFLEDIISAQQLRKIAIAMMDHSYYARESELASGYFTLKNGCRVGVCGSFTEKQPGIFTLRSIGSLCIRVSRSVPGCACSIVSGLTDVGMCSALLLSRPGLGKTTLLRDTARLLSNNGYTVGIADERHELAACCDGVPTMDIGSRTDVVDGRPKAQAMEHLIRSMSPDIIVTDEIGNPADAAAIREASRMGVCIIASAHASTFDEFESGGIGTLIREGLFPMVFLIDGSPGHISQIRHYDRSGKICS